MDLHTAREILGVPADSSAEQIREAYLDLVKVWHPDRFTQASRLRSKAEEKLKQINLAYDLATAPAPPRGAPRPRTPQAPSPSPASRPNSAGRSSSAESVPTGRQWSQVWWVGCLIALWWAASIWDSYLSQSSPSPRPTGTYALSDIEPVPTESAIVQKRPLPGVRCEADIAPPKSGAEIGGRHRGGLGSLTIKNGSESDAIAVVVDAATQRPRRAVYIRRGEVGLMRSMPVGTYILRFQFGDTWLESRRFCNISSTSEFEERIAFTERQSDTGTEFSRVELTLYTVQGGNAPTDTLPNVPLSLPDP